MAEHLGMTIADMRARMGQGEYVLWTRYYARKAQREELDRKRAGA